jgi:hypothetical protein
MPLTLLRWKIDVTWTPDPATYPAVTRTLYFLAAAADGARVSQMAVAQSALCESFNPVTYGSPSLDSDQRQLDRNGAPIT